MILPAELAHSSNRALASTTTLAQSPDPSAHPASARTPTTRVPSEDVADRDVLRTSTPCCAHCRAASRLLARRTCQVCAFVLDRRKNERLRDLARIETNRTLYFWGADCTSPTPRRFSANHVRNQRLADVIARERSRSKATGRGGHGQQRADGRAAAWPPPIDDVVVGRHGCRCHLFSCVKPHPRAAAPGSQTRSARRSRALVSLAPSPCTCPPSARDSLGTAAAGAECRRRPYSTRARAKEPLQQRITREAISRECDAVAVSAR